MIRVAAMSHSAAQVLRQFEQSIFHGDATTLSGQLLNALFETCQWSPALFLIGEIIPPPPTAFARDRKPPEERGE